MGRDVSSPSRLGESAYTSGKRYTLTNIEWHGHAYAWPGKTTFRIQTGGDEFTSVSVSWRDETSQHNQKNDLQKNTFRLRNIDPLQSILGKIRPFAKHSSCSTMHIPLDSSFFAFQRRGRPAHTRRCVLVLINHDVLVWYEDIACAERGQCGEGDGGTLKEQRLKNPIDYPIGTPVGSYKVT